MGLLRKILGLDEKGRAFMANSDKVETKEVLQEDQQRYCPPHRIPHVLPWQPKVTDEPCHIHTSSLRHYGHHAPFCKIMKCPNYETMCKAKREYKK